MLCKTSDFRKRDYSSRTSEFNGCLPCKVATADFWVRSIDKYWTGSGSDLVQLGERARADHLDVLHCNL